LDAYGYGPVAFCYEELAALYSLGRIAASKRSQIEALTPGSRILYAGVGRGEDALHAARSGMRVTGVDVSPGMLARLARRLQQEGLEARLVQGNAARLPLDGLFDAVAANYFLNLYDEDRAREMLARLIERLRPGGLLLIADFAPASGGRLGRWITQAYYRPVNVIAWVLGLCALHPIFDYASMLEPMGFQIRSQQRFPVLAGRDPAFVSIVAERADGAP